MNVEKSDSNEAFLALIDVAEAEIVDAIDGLPAKGSASLLRLCRDHLETIIWAAEVGDMTRLHTVSTAIQTYYAEDLSNLTVKRGTVFVNWLSTIRDHFDAPEDEEIHGELVLPLPANRRALVEVEPSNDSTSERSDEQLGVADIEAQSEWPDDTGLGFPDEQVSTADIESIDEAPDISMLESRDEPVAVTESKWSSDETQITGPDYSDEQDVVTNFEQLAEDLSVGEPAGNLLDDFEASIFAETEDDEFDTSSMLGMLASELHQSIPSLSDYVKAIAVLDDPVKLNQTVESYQEFISRIYQVSEDLGLVGLILVCDFVNNNVARLAALPCADRTARVEIFRRWPQVIIDHLVEPMDDKLLINVIEYLENDSWPDPLPYRDVRDYIEGLAKGPEVSGNSEVEKRQREATAADVALEISDDVSNELREAFFDESPGHAETFSHLVEAISSGDNIQQNVESAQRIAHTLKGSGNLVGATGIATFSHHIEDIFEYIAAHKMTPPRALAYTMQEAADTIESMLEYLQGIAPPPDEAQRVLQDVLNWANRIDRGHLRRDDFDEEEPATLRAMRRNTTNEDMPDTISDRRMQSDQAAAVTARQQDLETNTPESLDFDVKDKDSRELDNNDFDSKDASESDSDADEKTNAELAKSESVRVPIHVLDNIFRIVSETAIAIGQIQEHLGRLDNSDKQIRSNDSGLQQRRYELENLVSIRGMAARHRHESVDSSNDFDPLEMDEYDEFYGATHAYIEGVADSRHILREFTSEVTELNALFLLQQRLNKELQEVVMTTRMVPVNSISARLHRTVRQACRMTGKSAELTISGDDLLLDGDVLNRLANPLMHVLRNAVDHGIEDSEQRIANQKSEVGQIKLGFRQEGNSVLVECIDDGGGLNYERIRETAIRRGLISEQDSLNNPELSRMILRSGFSTSEKVTQVSGRGVGMDVVRDTIQVLKGSMDIADGPDDGTVVSLRLPITLLTSHCLLTDIGDNNVFAIPTSSLKQILSPGIGELGRVGTEMTYTLGKDVYIAYALSSLLGMPNVNRTDGLENSRVLLVQTTDGIKAVTVDHVVSSYDLVLKSMGAYVKSLHGVAGVSILGDGSVVAVLDLSSLLKDHRNIGPTPSATESQAPVVEELALPKVLVVDDSLSVRNSLSQLMSDGGYRVVTARDGLEAVDLLEDEQPDIILTDLEMPRMNGLDLVSYVRNSVLWNPIPVVMITSRTMAKHRQQAETAGVNCYITKPFTEDEVLASIDQQLAQLS